VLELLLALAIIALLGGVLIGGSARLLSDQPVSADEVFWKAVQQARKSALKSGVEVRLTFVDDRDKGKFFAVNDGTATKEFALVPATSTDLAVTFLVAQKGGNAVLVAGTLVETQTIPFVTFYADGTCTAFRAQFQRGSGVHTVAIDPWTCAQVLTPPDPNAPPTA
jgi:general secretion pathway protein H